MYITSSTGYVLRPICYAHFHVYYNERPCELAEGKETKRGKLFVCVHRRLMLISCSNDCSADENETIICCHIL